MWLVRTKPLPTGWNPHMTAAIVDAFAHMVALNLSVERS
jgi:hypothetical protein